MANEKSDASSRLEILSNEINHLNDRLSRLETAMDELRSGKTKPVKEIKPQADDSFDLKMPLPAKGSVELRVGEYGMAWLGNIVMFFAITFLSGYFRNSGGVLISTLIGFVSVAGIYISSWFTRNAYSYLSKLFAYNGHLLLYFFTLQLHFFQEDPAVEGHTAGLILIMAVTAGLFYVALRRKSQMLAGIALLMLLANGIFGNTTALISGVSCLAALLATLLYYRYGWLKLTFGFVFLVYLAHLNGLLNNPLMGNPAEFIKAPGIAYVWFVATGFIFSMVALIPKREEISNEFGISTVIWNGLGFTFLLIVIVVTYFQQNYVNIFIAIALFCLVYSVILQLKSPLKITASIYVLYGFMALSVTLYGLFGLPDSYMLFALQSLLVVSTALWFRSRFMVVMNTLLFLGFMAICLIDSPETVSNNFAFMLVAFLSARVINWKKERLQIKTQFVRNIYLASGLVMTLIALYHAFPGSYITASWIAAAIVLFILSLLMKNKKYRWLAITVMVTSAVRLIFVDMSTIEIGYRVMIFLALAVISIVVSILYTKYFMKNKE